MVIFPLPGDARDALVAAVFPDTGVPELPKASGPNPSQQSSSAPPNPQSNPGFPPGFQNWPPQQKQEFVAKMLASQQSHRAQQQAQTSPDPQAALRQQHELNPFASVGQTATANAAMLNANANPLNTAQNVANMMSGINMNPAHLNVPGYPRRPPTGPPNGQLGTGGMQNVSLEMLQSFMQRNPDGMGGVGPS